MAALQEGINRLAEIQREGYPVGVNVPTIWKGMTCDGSLDHCPPGWTLTGHYTTTTDSKGNHEFGLHAWLITNDENFHEKTKTISWGMGGFIDDDITTERFLCKSNS